MTSESNSPVDKDVTQAGQSLDETTVEAAIRAWTGQLVDLGGRNTLLYYRDLTQGTLALDDAEVGEVIRLLGSHTVRLSSLISDEHLLSAARRARAVRAKARENFEERGLQTLFLAWGMATWDNARGTATPAAPVLLRQAHLAPRGGSEEDFDISLPGEWEVNPTLLHLLATDHAISIDGDSLLGLLDVDSEHLVGARIFDELCERCREVPGFGIAQRVVLGNFSYAKLPMVRDIQANLELLQSNPLIAAIAGDEGARERLRREFPITVREDDPDRIPPADEYLVLDADASQNYVINAAVRGANVVCVGPPGTGKSQTIANLIATLSARGKRVLFVAEKRAAIDAVLKRLSVVGLGDLVIDLHDGSGPRRQVAQQLARALSSASQVPLANMRADHELLATKRSELSARSDALHRKREHFELSVYEIQSELLGFEKSVKSDQRLSDEVLSHLDADALRHSHEDLVSFVDLGGFAIWNTANPWLEAFKAGSIPDAEQASAVLSSLTTLVSHTLPEARAAFQEVISEVGLTEPESLTMWPDILQLLDDVSSTLATFQPDIFRLDLSKMKDQLAPLNQGLLARFSHLMTDSDFRSALRTLKDVFREKPPEPSELHRAVSAATQQLDTWRQLAPSGTAPNSPTDFKATKARVAQLTAEVASLESYVQRDLLSMSSTELDAELQRLIGDQVVLFRMPKLHHLNQLLHRRGLGDLLDEMRERQLTAEQAAQCLRFVWLTSLLARFSISDPLIGAFDGAALTRIVQEFRNADLRHLSSTPQRIKRAVAENITSVRDEFPQESQVVAYEAAKKRRHLPIRQLFQAAPHVLGAVKPCWAMSPLVVSQLLPAQQCFDVVIFDEASQVTPADAVGSLMRAGQVVVAGDPHQLPPTPFFATSNDGDENGLQPANALTQDLESVLDQMSVLLPSPIGTRTLRWHYRSRDERLIAFSNAQPALYDWSLITFPGVVTGDVPEHHLVSSVPSLTEDESSTNAEVAKVVELVMLHAREHPDESLGVIAMGIKHAERIQDALRRVRQSDLALDEFMSERDTEPFFVKNLERVQGDERDAIILTIGYGKLPDGRMQYRFGPLNQEGGERRLNVAVTRARSRMAVVSSFSSEDMDPNRLRAEGAKMLARYLTYAESGGKNLGALIRERPNLNPFELDVKSKLEAVGIPLVPQFGVSGYWLDFAAEHPTHPGRMVLAIEADGASYHSSHTARDRDRLRQQHLENLGWSFHRIWSTDWFYNHEREVTRAQEAYRQAVARSDSGIQRQRVRSEDRGVAPSSAQNSEAATIVPERASPQPVKAGRGNIVNYGMDELVQLIRWIESDTLLRTEDELLLEVMACLGFRKRGSKIVAAITGAIKYCRRPEVRDRSRVTPGPTSSMY